MTESAESSKRRPRTRGDVGRTQGGFSMVEILVTMAIIAVTVLGMAGMQAQALRVQKDASTRSAAIVVALGLVERIETNNVGAVANAYVANLPTALGGVVDCRAANCTAAQMATFDLDEFQKELAARLPGATATITAAGAGPIVYTIAITWTARTYVGRGGTLAARNAGAVDQDGRAAGGVDAGSNTETMMLTMTRRIYDRSVVL